MFCCAPGIELVNIWKLFANPAVLKYAKINYPGATLRCLDQH